MSVMRDMSEATDGDPRVFRDDLSESPPAEAARRPAVAGGSVSACATCGAPHLARPGLLRRGIVVQATLPREIAAALRLIPALTPRERATFELLGLGYDNRSIARTLEISERTAKRHVTAILSKLELESRLQAGLTALIVSSSAPAAGS